MSERHDREVERLRRLVAEPQRVDAMRSLRRRIDEVTEMSDPDPELVASLLASADAMRKGGGR